LDPAIITSNVQCVRSAAGRRTLKNVCCYRSRLVFNCCLLDNDISHGSLATNLRCSGIFSGIIIANVLLILALK